MAATGPLTLEQKLQDAGLELLGNCQKMSGRGPGLLEHSSNTRSCHQRRTR